MPHSRKYLAYEQPIPEIDRDTSVLRDYPCGSEFYPHLSNDASLAYMWLIIESNL